MKKQFVIKLITTMIFTCTIFLTLMVVSSEKVNALSYNGEDLALAILKDPSTLVSSNYVDTDTVGFRQAIVLSSHGIMHPTDGNTFLLLSTGIAGTSIVTSNQANPGSERGTWFKSQYGNPRDTATLTMVLQVPMYMHYVYYDAQFFSAEYPEYVGSKYDDKLTITVNSPSKGKSTFQISVNSGYFVLDSQGIPGTGFDIFAQSGNPADVDIVDTQPRTPGADAGASSLIVGGAEVSPNELITVTIKIEDVGDNQFDSAAFIDNFRFSGYAKTDIIAKKEVFDLNGGEVESNDVLKYVITITNTGTAKQKNNPGNEFEDYIPENTTYVPGSAYSQYGTIAYDSNENKIVWNGEIPAQTSRVLEFKVKINENLSNGQIISNQGTVYWDSNEDGTNNAIELTDDIYVDDGIDQDGDGNTDDDDPTTVTVYAFDNPSYVTEDFSDDTTGEGAVQYYLGRKWFETNKIKTSNSCFEIARYYYYSTSQSFKTKIRNSDGPLYWNYSLSALNNPTLVWWEIWFACGDTSEEYSFNLHLQDKYGQDIAKLKFDYVNNGSKPSDWVLELFFWDPANGWVRLSSNYLGGY
ncbi:MAG: choice-of-anchor L domain-containing protein, partial [Candidatus Thermoplasmatota archaeon]|nr:choice-of-anchor L domain-containing protein [Candidatus Thermoplasmatota archaeon]